MTNSNWLISDFIGSTITYCDNSGSKIGNCNCGCCCPNTVPTSYHVPSGWTDNVSSSGTINGPDGQVVKVSDDDYGIQVSPDWDTF